VTTHENGHVIFPPAFKDGGGVDAAVVPAEGGSKGRKREGEMERR